MTTRGSGEIDWYSYDLPSKIDDLTDSSYAEFWYGPDRSRIKQYQSGTGVTLRYAGTLFEFEDAATDTYRHYVQAGDQVIAVVERVATTNTRQYLHRDHQGSVVKVTNASGTVDQALAFDAWGLRRNASDWSALGSPFAGSHEIERGYTGHEHLDAVGLIHMNGRVQDPILGRFISADPLIQGPYSTQSHNRYSYVWNNPTSKSDPSGFCAIAAGMQGLEEQCAQEMRNLYTAFTDHLMWLQGQAAEQEGLAWDLMEYLEPFTNFGFMASMAHLDYGEIAQEIMSRYGASTSNATGPATYPADDVTAARLVDLTREGATTDTEDERSGYVLAEVMSGRGVRAALWVNGDSAVIAIAGTNGIGDLFNVGLNLLGLPSPQLRRTVEWATGAIERGGFSNVTAAGHSLGATYAMGISSVTGVRAVTFNSIGITNRAIGRIEGRASNMDVTSYRFNQDIAGVANVISPASSRGSTTLIGNGFHFQSGVCQSMGCY